MWSEKKNEAERNETKEVKRKLQSENKVKKIFVSKMKGKTVSIYFHFEAKKNTEAKWSGQKNMEAKRIENKNSEAKSEAKRIEKFRKRKEAKKLMRNCR